MVNWKEVVEILEPKQGKDIRTSKIAVWDAYEGTPYEEFVSKHKNSNFNEASIGWSNYYPDKDFDRKITNEYAEKLGLKKVHRSWISRVYPGYIVPWHYDVEDDHPEFFEDGITRYSIFITDSEPGQILIIGDKYHFNYKCGDIIKWDKCTLWHCGVNTAFKSKYTFHLIGF